MKRFQMRGEAAASCEGDECALPQADTAGRDDGGSTTPVSGEENPQPR